MKSGVFVVTTTPAAGPDAAGRVFLVQAEDAGVLVGGPDGQHFALAVDTPVALGTEYAVASNLQDFWFKSAGSVTVQFLKQL